MKTRFHKLTAWLLTLAMLMTFIPTFSQMETGLKVYAAEGTGSDGDDSEFGGGTGSGDGEAGSGGSSGTEGDGTEVSYLAPVYEDGKIMFDENNDVVFETKTVTDYIVAEDIAYGGTITSADQMPTVGTSGETAWYLADSDVEWENFVLVRGDVHLIVCDDVTVTSLYGIVVSDGNSLTIYGQENGTGTLVAKGVNYSGGFYSAAIGGCDVTTEMANGGTITINGGIISASASPNAAAIGGSKRGTGGTITINGGSVDAKGAAYSAAIGGGSGGNSGNITINGGIVSAETSGSSSAIGAGYVRYSSTGGSILAKTDKIEINGGTVVATQTDSYAEYPVIGGLYGFDNINISGGHITVNHARSGGIGIGTNSVTVMEFYGNLNISGGTIISGNDKTLYLGAGKTSSSAKGTVDVVVTGGNISGMFKNVSTLTDGKNDVEMKEITIDGAEDQTEVTVLEDYPTYGFCDVVTDGDKVVIYVPVSDAYTVTISAAIRNGTVEADVSEASEGDTVTLTVTPAENYDIDTVSYNDGTNDVEITATEGVYSFTMPASNVTVTAVFKESVTYVASVTTAGEGGATENYSSITDAITAAKENDGSTLKLLADVDTNVLIDGGTFTLDLNGHNIEADTKFDGNFLSRAYALTILNDANITLKGSGSIISNSPLDDNYTTSCYCIYNRGKLRIDGDIELKTNEYQYNSGISNSTGGQLTIDNCRINATLYAISCYKSNTTINGGNFQSTGICLDIENANVTVKGGSFTGEGYDCYVYASSNPSTLKLGVGDDGSGPAFPGGILVSNTVSLSDILDENCYFKQNGTPVDMTDITTEITGDVSVAYCDHSENTNTIPTADDASTHSLFCSDCGTRVSQEDHSLDGGICTDCGYGCSHSSCITENNVTKCDRCPVVLVAQVGDTYFAKFSDAVAAANDTNGSTLTLLADVKGDFTADTSSVFTLDLNGKTLRGTSNGSIITVDTGAELTIKSSASGGKITGCDNQSIMGTIYVYGKLKLESGAITGNSVDYGGGVVVKNGTFVMNGGEITGNTAEYSGGGVYIAYNGSFTMNGGSISDNVVRIDDKNRTEEGLAGGGGVFIREGTFTMNGGTISGNRSPFTRGGGVQVSGYGTFIMNGGAVTGNSALEKGGGVYVMNGWENEPAGSFTVNGNSVISGNTVNGTANNVYLEAPLSIGSDLSTTAGIGITGSTTPTDTGFEIASSGATEINKSAFISDNINYSIVQKEGKLYLYPHIHSWNYELDDTNTNTINATCTTACLETGTKTIVISASDKVYDGTAVIATVTNNVDSTDYSESIIYEAKTGSLTEGKAVNAGTYTASITIGGVTASVDFTIGKADPIVTAPEAIEDLTYNRSEQALVTAGQTIGGTMFYSLKENDGYSTDIPKGFDAGEYTIWYFVQGGVNHNDSQRECISVTVAKKVAYIFAVDANKTYGEEDPGLHYKGVGLENGDGVSGTLIREEGENVGEYDITLGTLTAGSNYTIDYTGEKFTITPKSITISGATIEDVMYDEDGNYILNVTGVSFDGLVNGEQLTIGTDYTATAVLDGENAVGKVPALITVTLIDKNYTLGTANKEKFSVNILKHSHDWRYSVSGNTITIKCNGTIGICPDAEQSISISAYGKIYDGTPVIAELTGSIDGVTTPEIIYSGNTNAGTHTASITIGEATASAEFTIEKKSIDGASVAAFDVMTYDGQPQTPNAVVTIDNHTVTGTWSTVTNVYDKTTFTANGNFTGTIADKETGMAKADPTYTEPTAKNGLVYSGSAQELLNPGTAEGGTMKYYIGGTQATEEVPTRTPAGEYTVNCIIAGDANHNNIVVGEYTVTIAKKTIDNVIALTAPVKNKVPQTEITAPGYTVAVVWSPEVTDKFEYNTQYTATVTITPDDNHTVAGIAENGYLFEGAKTVSNTQNSNVVTVSYEKTGSRPSSGGGGGSSNTSTTTTKNEDGSTTKTTTNKATGTVTEVTTNTDGSTTTVETKKDGTVTTTEKDKEGNTTTTALKPDGTSTTTEKNKDGTKVTTQTNADGETTAKVEVKGETEVVIPVYDAKKVTKVIVTDENGKETEARFEVKDGGIAILVSGNSTISVQTGHTCYAKEFTDVDLNSWYHFNIDYVLEKGLFKGTTKTTFAPNDNLTRAMLVTVLYRKEGEPAVNRSIPFSDVDMGAYYADAVVWAKQNGIVAGYSETSFGPHDNITREQIAAIIYRYAQYKGMDVVTLEENLHFEDSNDISDYAVSAMNWAVGKGLIKGKSEATINPKDNSTRAEVAAIIHRFAEAK